MNKELYRERLKSIFHKNVFTELMNFWKMVEESDYDYKIFVSKKCYVLYKVCMPLFDFNTYENCVKITDTAIPIYLDQIKKSRVLVIDDVFIHGRAASKIKREIGSGSNEIVYYTFAKNCDQEEKQDISTQKMKDTQTLNRKLSNSEQRYKDSLVAQREDVHGYINCKEFEWKRISDLIMKSLWGVNMPYSSNLPIFVMRETKNICSPNMQKRCYHYSSYSQKTWGQQFSYYIETNNSHNSIIHYCFIISKNKFMNDCKITPMVLFDCENTSIDKKFIFDGLNIIFGEEKADDLKQLFIKGNNNGIVSLFEFYMFCVSYLAMMRWFEQNEISEEEYYVDFGDAEFSFGAEITNYLVMLKSKKVNDLLNKIENCTIKSLPNEMRKQTDLKVRKELLEGLKRACADTEICDTVEFPRIVNVLSRYFKFNNIYREENLYKNQKLTDGYVSGLKFSDIKDFLKTQNFTNEEIIFGLMCRYNQGAATIDFLFDYNKMNRLVGINMYWRAGEQSYKCISQTYVLIVYFQNLYDKWFTDKAVSFLYERLVEVAIANYKYYKIPFSKKDLENYCSKRDNVYNAFDIERYCEREQYKYLGYIAKQMEQYVLSGNVSEIIENDVAKFKENLFAFMENHTDKDLLINCEKILRSQKE